MNANPETITILIADDDADDRQMAKEALEECRLANHLDFVEDGVELLNYLRGQGQYAANPTPRRPGLIILDLNMPKMDGPGDQGRPVVAADSGRGHDDFQGRRGHLPHL
jgi:CheY-like chemotaxis protein